MNHHVVSKWTHSICKTCWYEKNPGRRPTVLADPDVEKCCYCGGQTQSGIYVGQDPAEVHGNG